jgi:pimeloyl-ACP methyl ester carboxylesterase
MSAPYLVPPLQTATTAGRRMAWRELGPEHGLTPLVLMHGIGSSSRAWGGQFAAFGGERRVIAWNAPGYAGSDPLAQPAPGPADYAQALLGLVDHLGLDRIVLVGQSLGAIMATAAALAAPTRVESLVLVSPAGGYATPFGQPLPASVQSRLDDLADLGPAGLAAARSHRLLTDRAGPLARDIVRQAMAEIRPDGYVQASRMLAGADLPAMMPDVRAPTTVIWAAEDVITPPAGCRRVADSLPGATAVELPRGGHAVATEYPEMFNAALRAVLEAVKPAMESTWI